MNESGVKLIVDSEPSKHKQAAMLIMAAFCEFTGIIEDGPDRQLYKEMLRDLGVLLTMLTGLRVQDVADVLEANRQDMKHERKGGVQ